MLIGELEHEDMLERTNYRLNTTINGAIINGTIINGRINTELEDVFEQTYFPVTTHLILTFFMFFMAIIVINLLFGLAVTDVQVYT